MTDNHIASLKTSIKVFLGIAILLILLFESAGTIYWIEAWILVLFYLLTVLIVVLWLRKNDPDLLKERTLRKSEGKLWDKILLFIYTILLFIMLIICGLDAVRYEWTKVPFIFKVFGFLGFIPVTIIIFKTFKENTYLSKVVRIQKDRSHQVVKTGPYKFVRHPMYVSVILFVLLIPFALGSFVALLFSGLIIIVFIVRTYLEDETLQEELTGYKEYTQEVRYRLIPGIW